MRLYLPILAVISVSCSSPHQPVQQPAATAITPAVDLRQKWFLDLTENKMDQRPVALLTLNSEESPNATLVVRCTAGKPEVFLNTHEVLETERDGGRNIRVRFDDELPQPDVWSLSTDDTGLFSTYPKYLLKDLLETKMFLVEYRPFEHQPRTVSFHTDGLKETIVPAAKVCGLNR